jgi:predicted NAD-dependent protein-ADP-ribosyltransferase YbiA (DUF1768 family)
MRTELKGELLILVPETPAEESAVVAWKEGREGHVLALLANRGKGATVRFLGPHEEVCREPINVTSKHPDPQIRLIGNFAATPFELDGVWYASIESFWQALKFPEGERARIAAVDGSAAKRAGAEVEYGTHVCYQGAEVAVGTWAHWQLMERACRAKFTQNFEAMSALIATGERPLVHKMRKDSRTIPGAIMAEIWMRIRKQIAAQAPGAVEAEEEVEA